MYIGYTVFMFILCCMFFFSSNLITNKEPTFIVTITNFTNRPVTEHAGRIQLRYTRDDYDSRFEAYRRWCVECWLL